MIVLKIHGFCRVLLAITMFAAFVVVLSAILCASGCQKPPPPSSEGDAKGLAEAKAFLAGGGDINTKDKDGWTKMRHAVWNDHLGTMRFLIANGTDLKDRDRFGCYLLHAAALRGHIKAMKLLVEHGAEIDGRGPLSEYTALHLAAMEGSLGTVEFLVQHRANVNVKLVFLHLRFFLSSIPISA